jgi:NAD kinase
MKVLVYAYKKDTSILKRNLQKRGFNIVKTNPDVVISVGGDGTLLYAEREYPTIPKILVKESKICYQCSRETLDQLIKKVQQNKYRYEKIYKIETKNKKGARALNEITIRNKDQRRALRFQVKIGNKICSPELIGDGVVIATSYGSEAYFKAVTGTSFKRGIGIAFNNTRTRLKPIISKQKKDVTVKILRGDALVSVDNSPKMYTLKPYQSITVRQSKECARIMRFYG